jgi:ATP-dependent Clp protease adapter protein ClpS
VRRADAAETRAEEVEREGRMEQMRLKERYRKSLQGFLE